METYHALTPVARPDQLLQPRVLDLDGAILLSPRLPVADKLSAEFEDLTKQAGLSLEELLGGLPEQRARYHADRLERP